MVIHFADCELDPERFELRRGGEPVHVEPKVFDMLDYLIRQKDRVVTKNELLDALWPGEAVTESVLSRAITAVRRAVGDDRQGQKVVQTVHGRGYRFVAAVADTVEPDGQAPLAAEIGPPPKEEPGFVGRKDVLGELSRSLGEALARRGQVVMLAGEPGIGKTATADRLIDLAGARGARCWLGRCREGEGAPAFWPWIQILRACTRDLEDEALGQALGVGASEIATLVPEVRDRLPQVPEPRPGAAGDGKLAQQVRFRLFDSLAGFFRNLAAEGPLVLVLDDLHWADAASVLFVDFLSDSLRDVPILLLATYRDTEVREESALSDVLGALASQPCCTRLSLRGLSPDEIARVFALLTGREPEAVELEAVADLTEGNPFFVREIAQQWSEASEGKGRHGPSERTLTLALPQSVRDAIGRRLRVLSPACRELLDAAAVLGRDFRAPTLAAMLGSSPQEILETLAEAVSAQVVLASDMRPGEFGFRHALILQTLYEAQSLPRRVSLHRLAGEVIERLAGGRVDDHLAELSHHFFEAAPGGDAGRAVDYAERAARQAHVLLGYEESARQYARALEALELVLVPDDERRVGLLLALSEELNTAGRAEDAQPQLRAAAALARRLGRPDLLARAAVTLWASGSFGGNLGAEQLAQLEEARATLDEDQTRLRALVLARLSAAEPYCRSMEGRAALAKEAYALASLDDDPATLNQALVARWYASLGPDRLEERYRVAEEQAELAERTGELRFALDGLETRLGAELITGEFERANATIDRFDQIAQSLRQPIYLHQVVLFRAAQAVNFGHYDEAERRLSSLLEMGRGMVPYAEALWGGMTWWLISQRGDDQAFDPAFFSGLEESILGRDHPLAHAGVGVAFMTREQDEPARQFFDRALAGIQRGGAHDEHWLYTLALLSDLSEHFADADSARIVYALALPYADLYIVHDLIRGVAGSVSSLLGTLAYVAGDLEAAETHLQQAAEREKAAGLRRPLASTLSSQAALAFKRGGPDDLQRAKSRMRECIALCERIGAPGQGAQYLARQARHGFSLD